MSSLKMTFSLTSLILIFALVFSAMPVLAHTTPAHTDPHPTVSITASPDSEYTATTDEKARDNFKVTITFSIGGSTDSDLFNTDVLEAGDLTFSGFNRDGVLVGGTVAQVKTGVTFADTRVAADKHEWVVPLQIDDATLRTLRVTVGPGVVTGNTDASLQANEAKSMDITDLPIVSDRTVDVTVAPVTTTPATNDYIVTFKFDGTTTVADFDLNQIVVTPESFRALLAAPVESTETDMQSLYTLAVNLTFDVQSVTIGVDPKFAAATEGKAHSVQVPPIQAPPPATQADPTVTIMIDALDTAERTFRVDVTSTPGAMSDNSAPKAQPVAHGDLEVKDAGDMAITTTVVEQDTVTDSTTNVSRYVAVLKYGLAANAPASVGLKSTFKTANTVTPAMFTAPPTAPGAPTGVMAVADQTANTITVSWTAPADNGGAAITGYTVTKHYMMAGAPATKTFAATASPLTIPPTGSTDMLPQGVNFTFTVTATNSVGTSVASSASAAVMINVDPGTGTPATAPTAAITVSNYVAATGNFDVRVVLTPATGGSAVTGFDHTYLTVMDSSTPAVPIPVGVEMGTTANPVEAPLMDDNLYVATLDYDTRRTPTLPLKVTINQSMLVTANPTHSADVGMGTPSTPPAAKAKATFSGTLSLSEQSTIEVTFDKAVTGLTTADFTVTGGTAVAVNAETVTAPTVANTIWKVAIDPDNNPFTESITVTIASTSTLAEPAAMKGSLTTRVADATLNSITAADGADDTAKFVVTLTFAEALPEGVSVAKTDLMVTPTTATIGEPGKNIADPTMWDVLITPTAGMDTKIELSETGAAKFAYAGDPITVMKKTTVTLGAVSATFVAGTVPGTGTTTLSGTIGADGFASISDFPDLEYFFEQRGTINLNDDDAADENDDNSREVVISEILWGLDESSAVIGERTQFQFIELYNTTNADVDVTGWTLVFSLTRPTDAKIDVDQVSSQPPFSLGINFLTVGKSGRVTNTLAKDTTATLSPARIVSMFRNINYATVVKPDHDANATENRKKQLAGVPDGNNIDSWKPSQRPDPETRDASGALDPQAARWVYATRNARHHPTPPGFLTATTYTSSPFRINEIGNDTGSDNDWVELHNVTDGAVKLENYALSAVTAKGTDTKLFDFAGNKYSVPKNGFVVIATRHPQYTDLATGIDVSLAEKLADAKELQDSKGLTHLYVVKPVNLPDDGKFTLILRNAHDKQGKKDNIVDVAASPEGAFSDVAIASKLWPLVGSGAPSGKVIKGEIKNYAAGKVYQRDKGDGRGDESFSVAGYTGIGYDIKAEVASTNHGTPGYANDARRVNEAGLKDGVITISEIMVDLGDSPRRNLPQWIELHNSSDTEGVNLDGWKINIENAAEAGMDPETNTSYATLTLGAITILPNQTVLIVARSGEVRNPDHFPVTRVINLSRNQDHRKALAMSARDFLTKPILSTKGFSIELVDKDNESVDRAGNIDGLRHTRDDLATKWAIPMSDDPGSRSSILRVYHNGMGLPGGEEDSWKLASDTILAVESHAYYGSDDDIGTPGYRFGGPLPVSLSKFRPERLKDTGEIVVRWITESELNNAGFNILRSEKRDGEFTKLHFEAGQGTTSERNVYEWKDKSAKPNVVYYYQIQDVSLDGEVTTLRVTHLRGNVTAAGKLTTTWGEIKALQ